MKLYDGIFRCGGCGAELPADDDVNQDFCCVYCGREFCGLACLERHDVDECERRMAEAEVVDNQLEAMRCDRD